MTGTYCDHARTKARRLAAVLSSLMPVRQKLLVTIQVPGVNVRTLLHE